MTALSVEETEHFATDSLSTSLFVIHNSLICGQDNETELTGGKDRVGEVFEVLEFEIESW